MDILTAAGLKGKGTKRKAASSTTTEGAKKKSKKIQEPIQTRRRSVYSDEEDDTFEGQDDDMEEYPVYGEDDSESRENEELLGSDEVVDGDGWSKIVKNDRLVSKTTAPSTKKKVEVLELD
jgi:hypothetical protein